LVGDAPAVTFNAAGLSEATARRYGVDIRNAEKIDAYYIRGDILSVIQDYSPLPNAIGNRIPLTAYHTLGSSLQAAPPMTISQTLKHALNGRLHFMGAVETAIYSNFPVFQK